MVRRHPYHAALAALVGGLVSAGAGSEPAAFEVLALAIAAVAATLAAARAPWLGLACALLLAIGWGLGGARLTAIDAPRALVAAGVRVDATAVLLERPRSSAFGSSAEVELTDGDAAGARLVARATGDLEWPAGAAPGQELALTGFAHPPKPSADPLFDWPAHLRRQGIAGELELEAVRATGSVRGGLAGVLDRARGRAEDALAGGMGEREAALIRAMVLGQDDQVDPLVEDDFRVAGLAHILVVSGQNVLLLSLLALPVLAQLGLGPRLRLAVVAVLIAAYVPLAGAGPSLQRAGVMGTAGLVALAAGRPTSRWYALLLAAAATLAVNPRVCGDPGWQLSFAAVAGILLLAPRLRGQAKGLARALAEGVAVTLAATVATAPLLAHHFGRLSIVGLAANMLALPAIAPAMWIGMVEVAFAQLPALVESAGPVVTALVDTLGAINGVLLAYIGELARRFAEPSWADAAVQLGSPATVVAAYAAIALAALATIRLARRASPGAATLGGLWRTARPGSRAAVALAVTVAALGAILEATGPGAAPERLTVSFLDVGQGDATLVQHPGGGSILIDGGPPEGRAYRLVGSAGADRLDLVIATHAAADHHGGLLEVLERVPVGMLLEGGDGTTDSDFNAFLAEADRHGVRRLPARAGQTLRVGELTVEVLAPGPRPPGPPPEDPNPRAVTVLVSAGDFELLASGDAESPSLAPLELPDVDLLKVPHHGSDDPGLDELLARIRPEIAAIGVGADNGYGHPAPSTLGVLEAAGADVYRTDLDGTITVTVADEEMRVATER